MVRIDPDCDWDNLDWLQEYDEEDRPNEHIISLNRHLQRAINARLSGAKGPLDLGKAPYWDYYEFMSDAKHSFKFSFGMDENLQPCTEQVLYWGEPVGVHYALINAMHQYIDRQMFNRLKARIRTVVTQRLCPGIFKDLDAGWGTSESTMGMARTETVCEFVWANESSPLALALTRKWSAISNCLTMQVWVNGMGGDVDCDDLDVDDEENLTVSFLIMTQAKGTNTTQIYRYGQAAQDATIHDDRNLYDTTNHHTTVERQQADVVLPASWFTSAKQQPPIPLCLEAFRRAVIKGLKQERRLRLCLRSGLEPYSMPSEMTKEQRSIRAEQYNVEYLSLLDAEKVFAHECDQLSSSQQEKIVDHLEHLAKLHIGVQSGSVDQSESESESEAESTSSDEIL